MSSPLFPPGYQNVYYAIVAKLRGTDLAFMLTSLHPVLAMFSVKTAQDLVDTNFEYTDDASKVVDTLNLTSTAALAIETGRIHYITALLSGLTPDLPTILLIWISVHFRSFPAFNELLGGYHARVARGDTDLDFLRPIYDKHQQSLAAGSPLQRGGDTPDVPIGEALPQERIPRLRRVRCRVLQVPRGLLKFFSGTSP